MEWLNILWFLEFDFTILFTTLTVKNFEEKIL